MYTPTEVQMAHEMAEALNDKKSLAFYLSCTKKYPIQFLRTTLTDVVNKPDHAVYTTRARLFTSIVTNSIYNTHDLPWD